MKKLMKKLVAVVFTTLLAIASIPGTPVAAADTFTVYTDVPDAWGNPSIWAWNDIGNVFTSSWPGELMNAEENGWYSYDIPASTTHIIINDSLESGASQTEDLVVEPVDMWIIVSTDKSVEILYEAPEGAPGSAETESSEDVQTTEVPTENETQTDTPTEEGTFNPLTIIIPAICVTAIIVILIVSLCTNKKSDEE